MLTKKTSDAVLGLMTAGGDHDAQAVVSVARDVASRGWIIYFVDDRGRLNHCRTMDSVQEDGARATILNVAVDECTAGGIDPAALLDTGCSHTSQSNHMCCNDCGWVDSTPLENVAIEPIDESTRRETTTTTASDIAYGAVMQDQWGNGAVVTIVASGCTTTAYMVPSGKTAALRQSAAMQAMASVMGQVRMMLWTQIYEDEAFAQSMQLNDTPDELQATQLCGAMDRAASRWSAQVRAKLAEREEARRNNYAIRVQGEED